MLSELLQKNTLFNLLHKIDTDLATLAQAKGCQFCGGPLHFSNYERKPRGAHDNLPEQFLIRLSLCCGNKDCRRRNLPPSTLFMDRKVYWGCVILVVMTLKQNRPDSAFAHELYAVFGISRQTLKRWVEFFRYEFPESKKWYRLRGRVAASIRNDKLPGELVLYFTNCAESPEQGLVACLKFLAIEEP